MIDADNVIVMVVVKKDWSQIIRTARGDVRIRNVTEEDAHAYRTLRLRGLKEHPDAFGSDYETSAAKPIEYWQDRLRHGSGLEGVTYAAVVGELVGITSLMRNDRLKTRHAGAIQGVYVHPEWRGLGLGAVLVNECLEYARLLGLRLVRLGVSANKTSAIRLYEQCGFRVYGVEPESLCSDGVYMDQLLMARKLVD